MKDDIDELNRIIGLSRPSDGVAPMTLPNVVGCMLFFAVIAWFVLV